MGVSNAAQSHLPIFLVGYLLFVRSVLASCYMPNGTVDTGPEYAPCNNTDGETSMCCALNRGSDSDLCLSNGLCQHEQDSPTYWRSRCSDADWANNEYCLDVCLDSVNEDGNAQITPCDGTPDSETWCCGSTTDCCSDEHAVTLARKLGSRASSNSSTNNSSSTAPKDSGLSNGTKAGIGVGVSVGVIALMTFLFFVRRAERKRVGTSLHQHYDYRATGTTKETVGIPVNDLPSSSVTAKHGLPTG